MSTDVLACYIANVVEDRDRLFHALNAMLTHMGMDEDEWNKPTFNQAREAIRKSMCTGDKT